MSLLHDAYTALLSGLTHKENGKIRWANENNRDIWITIIDVNKEKYYVEYINNGDKYWYQNGLRHRLDGPAIEHSNGDKVWYQEGKLHRLDGPAVDCDNGDKFWYQNYKLHRLDGPAIEWADGIKYWYINGKELTEEEFERIINGPDNSKVL